MKNQTQDGLKRVVREALAELVRREEDIEFTLDEVVDYVVEKTGKSEGEIYEALASMGDVAYISDGGRGHVVVHGGVLHALDYFIGADVVDLFIHRNEENYVRAAVAKAAGHLQLLCKKLSFHIDDVESGEAKQPLDVMKMRGLLCDVANVLDVAADVWSRAAGEEYQTEKYYKHALDTIAKALEHEPQPTAKN